MESPQAKKGAGNPVAATATEAGRDAAEVFARLAPLRALAVQHDDSTVAAQIAVTEIPAPTGEETARGEWVANQFARIGLHAIDVDAAGNVMATHRGRTDAPPIVVCAHLDTVFPRDAIGAVKREGNRLLAPGIGDNGRGLAVMLATASAMKHGGVSTARAVRFVATTGEEGHGDLRGAKHYFASCGDIAAAIAIDGTGEERIVHRAVGSRRLRVTIDGPGGHSWSDYGVANPLHASAVAISLASALHLPENPQTTLTVSRTGGGLSVNSIPQRAWFEVDIRSVDDPTVRQLETALRGIVESAVIEANARRRAGTPALTCTAELIGDRPAGVLGADAPLVQAAMAVTGLGGVIPELATASTDANVPLSMGIPAITIGGGGNGGDVHTLGEWYSNEHGARGVARALALVTLSAERH